MTYSKVAEETRSKCMGRTHRVQIFAFDNLASVSGYMQKIEKLILGFSSSFSSSVPIFEFFEYFKDQSTMIYSNLRFQQII